MSLKINLVVDVAGADTNGLAASQNLDAAGYLTLAATLPGSGNQMVTLTSTDNLSGINFTVTGTVPGNPGREISVTVAGPNNETLEVDYFGTVTSIYLDAAMGALEAVEAGWAAKGVSGAWPCDVRQTPFSIGFGCIIELNSPTYSVQHTFNNVLDPDLSPNDWQWFTNGNVSGKTANTDGSYDAPVSAIRLIVTGDSIVSLTGFQAVQS